MHERFNAKGITFSIVIAAVLIGLVVRYFRPTPAVNVHDPKARRIDTFAIREGEFGVAVRVRSGNEPAVGAEVWADPQYDNDDEDDPDEPIRHATTDEMGLVSVPVRKNAAGRVHLFARLGRGLVGGATLDTQQVLAAPDVELHRTAPREGQLLDEGGQPIRQARLTVKEFSRPSAEEVHPGWVQVPPPLREAYTVTTDAQGRFRLDGVPDGADCSLTFHTPGHGQGTIRLPATADAVIRLAAAGSIRLDLEGEPSAIRRMPCRISAAPADRLDRQAIVVDGSRSLRHDGGNSFLIANVVPGKYVLQLEGLLTNPVLPTRTVTVEVGSGQTAGAAIPVRPAGIVVGRAALAGSENGVAGARVDVLEESFGAPTGYQGGRARTDAKGLFRAFVPADSPVSVRPHRAPKGFALSRSPFGGPGGGQTLRVAAGETVTAADIQLRRRVPLEGTVTSAGQPVANATVDVRWDVRQGRDPQTVHTDAAGRFRIPDAPPGQPVVIRIRSGDMVNARLGFSRREVAQPLSLPVSTGEAFRVRGRVVDPEGKPIPRAKVIVRGDAVLPKEVSAIVFGPNGQEDENAEVGKENLPGRSFSERSFATLEVEAVFTDADGHFTTGPLWPASRYTLFISADGLLTRRLSEIRAEPDAVHEAPTVTLGGKNSVVVGRVLARDGKPLAGVTVVNSGDGPKRVTATTDAAGRFRLTGLYDGPAVVVAHKAGYRWAFAIARPGREGPTITLPASTEPPAPFSPSGGEEHRRAQDALVAQLRQLAKNRERERPGEQPAPPPPDPWAEARKDLDGYLAKVSRQPGSEHGLTALAAALAKEDRGKALRVLKVAADAARRFEVPKQPALPGAMQLDFSDVMRAQGLIRVARTADEIGCRTEATAWLNEAEALTQKLPEAQRAQPLGELAVAWVTIDAARTQKLLAQRPGNLLGMDWQNDWHIGEIVKRLLRHDPKKALAWLKRFKGGIGSQADWVRGDVAVRFLKDDRATALRVADNIRDGVPRAITYTRAAGIVFKTEPKTAHAWIEKAAEALAAPPEPVPFERTERIGAAVYLLWMARAMAYPDLTSLTAVALTTRDPTPAGPNVEEMRQSALLRQVIGIGSADPATGRALFKLVAPPSKPKSEEDEDDSWNWRIAQALCDPAAAAQQLGKANPQTADSILQLLERRSRVIESFEFLRRMWWEHHPDELRP